MIMYCRDSQGIWPPFKLYIKLDKDWPFLLDLSYKVLLFNNTLDNILGGSLALSLFSP